MPSLLSATKLVMQMVMTIVNLGPNRTGMTVCNAIPGPDSSMTVYNDISPEAKQAALNNVIHSLDSFAGSFYQVLAKDEVDDNLVCSPISVSMVLSMLAFGARRDTKVQLDRTLGFPTNQTIVKVGLKLLNDRLNEYTEVTLKLANKIYLSDRAIEHKPEFTEVLQNTFNSSFTMLNFEQSQKSSDIINMWVEDNTNKRIKSIINPGDVDKDTALVLVNAVYFKGEWITEFNSTETKLVPFWVSPNTQERRTTMHSNGFYYYGTLEDVDARYVELPYKSKDENDGISMFIILPNKKDGLKKLEQNFANITVKRLTENSQNRTVDIMLPKFKIESKIDLKESLEKMGLTDMFTQAANFTGIASRPSLYVSKIKQKAVIEIDEKGSEAAAVTTVMLLYKFGSRDGPIYFWADHPFMAIIATTGNNPVKLFTVRYIGANDGANE